MSSLGLTGKTNLILENLEPKDDTVDVHKIISICKNLDKLQQDDKVVKPIILLHKTEQNPETNNVEEAAADLLFLSTYSCAKGIGVGPEQLYLGDVLSAIEQSCKSPIKENEKSNEATKDNLATERSFFEILQTCLKFKCPKCDSICKSAIDLETHKLICNSRVTEQPEDEEDAMFRKLNDENTDVSFMCHICNELFRSKVALRKHLEEHDEDSDDSIVNPEDDEPDEDIFVELANDPIIQCPLCKDFFKQEPFDQHIYICMYNNRKVNMECPICQKEFPPHAYNLHRADCIKNNKPFCLLPKVQELAQKNLNVPPNKKLRYKHVCHLCDKRFKTKQKIDRHLRIHVQKVLACEFCASTFVTKEVLDKHRLTAHWNGSGHPCLECGKRFSSKQGLSEHLKIHVSGPMVYSCKLCGKFFTSKQGYFIHQRMHNGEKPYSCEICRKSFRDGGTLSKHRRVHSGEKPFGCVLCEKSFTQKTTLRDHLRAVHGKNKTEFSCDLCTTILRDLEEMVAHMVKHSDEKRMKNENKQIVRRVDEQVFIKTEFVP